MSEANSYQDYLEHKATDYESRCQRCGSCCGAFDGDPCQHLVKGQGDQFFCDTYENRLGLQKTRAGREFLCVSIREVLFKSWSGSEKCVYKRALNPITNLPVEVK